jgi:hypothetical protein
MATTDHRIVNDLRASEIQIGLTLQYYSGQQTFVLVHIILANRFNLLLYNRAYRFIIYYKSG